MYTRFPGTSEGILRTHMWTMRDVSCVDVAPTKARGTRLFVSQTYTITTGPDAHTNETRLYRICSTKSLDSCTKVNKVHLTLPYQFFNIYTFIKFAVSNMNQHCNICLEPKYYRESEIFTTNATVKIYHNTHRKNLVQQHFRGGE